jgi:hypothetical protein
MSAAVNIKFVSILEIILRDERQFQAQVVERTVSFIFFGMSPLCVYYNSA